MAGEPAPYIVGGSNFNEQLSRTNSLPSGMNTVDNPVQLRLTSSRGHKKAQFWRSSVAVTNSDYYNQWRPQMSPLVKVHGSGAIKPAPSAPTLDTISEYEIELHDRRPSTRNQVADPKMFRYTPTPIPPPLSRPTTPQIGNSGFAPIHTTSLSSPTSATANIDFLRGSSQAIHITAAATNQFLPLFLNPETGNVYMFEDGYYLPIPSKSVKELEKSTKANTLTKPPTPVSSCQQYF